MQNLSVSGSVSGNNYVGGVVGDNDGGRVENCYNTGAVSGGEDVGGVVGWNNVSGIVTNCYNTGKVTGSADSSNVGGVVGQNSDSSRVENCYNTGAVSGGEDVGGVVGDNGGSGTVTGCYFLTGTAGKGIGNEEDAEGAAAVKDLSDLCENFKSDPWTISENLDRPVLKDNHEDDGSEQHPYEIFTATQLENFRDLVNGKDGNPAAWAVLMENIDLEGSETKPWTPIGIISQQYSGTFDGNGKTISGLYIKNTSSDTDYQGLFGFVGSEGTVQNLTVTGSVSGNNYVGGIAGQNGGRITDCAFSGNVNVSGNYVGGVVGA